MKFRLVLAVVLTLLVGGGYAIAQGIGTAGYEIKYGDDYYAARNYSMAAMRYRQAVSLDPTHAEAHFQLAKAYLQLGQATEAKAALEKAYALNPGLRARAAELPTLTVADPKPEDTSIGTPGYDIKYGDDYYAARNYSMAAVRYRQAVALDPTHAVAQLKLGMAYLQLGQAADAKAALDRAYSLNPALRAQALPALAVAPAPPPPPAARPAGPQSKAPAAQAKAAPRQAPAGAQDCDSLYGACYVTATRCGINGCQTDYVRQGQCMTERNLCYNRNGKR